MADDKGKKTHLTFSLSAGTSTFKFRDLEIPSELMGLGGKKLAVLIQLEGGQRVIQTFGNVPHDAITWRGIILGPKSFERWAQLDSFRSQQNLITLTYGTLQWTGVLEETELLPGFEGYLPYRIKFMPQGNPSVLNIPSTPTVTTNQAAVTSLAQANYAVAALATLPPTPEVTAAVTATQAAIPATQTAIGSSLTDALVTNPGGIGSAALQVTTALNATFALFSTLDVVTLSNVVMPAYTALGQLANLLEQPPTTPQVLLSADGRFVNLFLLAARYYGDPSQWTLLSLANGGISPFWTGLLSLVIPSAQ